jgi:hypothetical protein
MLNHINSETVIDWRISKINAQTKLANDVGEHNARRAAYVAHCMVHGDIFDRLDAAFLPILGADGFGQARLDFDGSYEVSAIHSSMIAAYQAEHGCLWLVAYRATRWLAFLAWDKSRLLAVAA